MFVKNELYLIINFQRPAFPDLNNLYYRKLLSQYRVVHAIATAL